LINRTDHFGLDGSYALLPMADAGVRRKLSLRQQLLNLAKERGAEFNFVLLRYGLERLLFRLGESRHAGSFVLKGAMLTCLAVFGPVET
jgi:hypothetical protein